MRPLTYPISAIPVAALAKAAWIISILPNELFGALDGISSLWERYSFRPPSFLFFYDVIRSWPGPIRTDSCALLEPNMNYGELSWERTNCPQEMNSPVVEHFELNLIFWVCCNSKLKVQGITVIFNVLSQMDTFPKFIYPSNRFHSRLIAEWCCRCDNRRH